MAVCAPSFTCFRMVRALRSLLSQDRLQVAFLILINISIVSVFFLYDWTLRQEKVIDWTPKVPFEERRARWERHLREFQQFCSRTTNHSDKPSPGPKPRPQPVTNILFVKTHKTGSSTVSNILLRHAIAQDWTICLPVINDGHMGWPQPPNSVDIYVPHRSQHCNLIAHHVVYRTDEFLESFFAPTEKLVKIAFIRDPLKLLESALYYFQEVHQLHLPVVGRLEEFLKSPAMYNAPIRFPDGGTFTLGQNFLSKEFGYDNKVFKDPSKFIEFVDNHFNLIGLTENHTESLVFMRRLTGLPLIALTYTHLNENMDHNFPKPRYLKMWLQKISPIDYQLYNYFAEKFTATLRHQPPDFFREVKCVGILNTLIRQFCTHGAEYDVLRIPATPWSEKVSFLLPECLTILKLPREITATVRESQFSFIDFISYFFRRFYLRIVR